MTIENNIQKNKHNALSKDLKKTLKFDGRFKDYLIDVEKATGRKISPKQLRLLKESIDKNGYKKLPPKQSHAHRSKFNSRKSEIILDWEKEYGEKWPTYKEPVFSRKGKVIRLTGDRYDCHHIVECSWGGDNQWYNQIPAKHPDEHQQYIHRKDGPADRIFNQEIYDEPQRKDLRENIREQRKRRKAS